MPRQGVPAAKKLCRQVAVVGGDFDDQAVGTEAEARGDHGAVVGAVLQPAGGGGGGGEVGVVAGEERVGGDEIFGLHQPAVVADEDLEGVAGVRAAQVVLGQLGVGRRGEVQVQEDVAQRGLAVAAVHAMRSAGLSPAKAPVIGAWNWSRAERSPTGRGQRMPSRGRVRRARLRHPAGRRCAHRAARTDR